MNQCCVMAYEGQKWEHPCNFPGVSLHDGKLYCAFHAHRLKLPTPKSLTRQKLELFDELVTAMSALEYYDDPGRFCDHAAEPCAKCAAVRSVLSKARSLAGKGE